jgi:hypothetical protein
VCDGYEPVKSPAKKITDTKSQSEINQSQHIKILADLMVSAGANPKRAISSVKHASTFLSEVAGTKSHGGPHRRCDS